MATAPSPFPTFPSVTPPPPFCFGAPPYAPYPFPYPNQPPPPSPSYHAAAYHHHHRFQLPPPSHPNPHWHQGMQQMQPPPPAPGNPWHPHHAAAQPPPPSSPPPRRPPPSSPPPLAASMAAVAPAWPFPSASVPAVQEGAAPSTSSSGRLPDSPGTTSAPAAALIVLCSGPGPERRPSSPSSAPVLAPSATQARRPTPQTIPSAEAQGQAEALVSKNLPRAVLDLKRRLDEHEAQTKRSFVSLQGQLSKLTDMFSSLTNSMVLSSTSSTTTAPTPSSGSTTMAASSPSLFCVAASSPRTSGGSCFGASSSAYAVPQVFDKMLTPSSGFENCSAHPNQIPSSYVQGGSTNLREQNIDGLPQTYGLHNLICRTVVRADGTEHIYYALPGDYPLERATPEPLFSNESVGVFASKPGQQPYKEEHQEDVQDFSLEVQQQDDEKACNVPVLKTSDSVVTSSSKLSSALVLRGLRWLWDPGALLPLMTSTTQHYSPALQPASHATAQGRRDTVAAYKVLIFQLPMSTNSHRWDPGDTTSYALFTTADSATNLQCTNVYKPAVVQILAVQFGVRRVLIFKSAVMHCDALGLARTKVTGSALFVLVVPGSAGTACPSPSFENMAKLLWDPGILHYMAPNGCNSALQDNSFILQMAAHLSECKYPCALYCICMMKAEYCPMRCLGEISASCMKRLQYNPGAFTHILLVLCVSCRAITDDCFAGQKLMANTSRKVAVLTWHEYQMDFIIGQCKFLHKQGVQSYNAKNLLSSSNYLQILEMGIIFITFLPP